MRRIPKRRGVSLLEVAMVLVILGLVAALTIPRLSRAGGRDDAAALRARLDPLRAAIERYYFEHTAYPAQRGDGQNAAGTSEAFIAQLTQYTDENGVAARRRSARFRFGPYLAREDLTSPLPAARGRHDVHIVSGPVEPAHDPTTPAAWIFNCTTGDIAANSAESDNRSRRYDTY